MRFCLEQTECDADSDALQEMIDNMESKHAEMQTKIDAQVQDELPDEGQRMMSEDEDRDRQDEWYDCMTDEVWSDEKQAWCDAQSEKDPEDEWYDCRTRELWSDEKQAWCDDFMDKVEWHKWDDIRKVDYSQDRAEMIEAAQ